MATNAPATRQETAPLPVNPFASSVSENLNVGNAAIESSRAVAEAQGMLLIAKRFPRNKELAWSNIMQACGRKSLAEVAIYMYPRGGQQVKGPSIRLAEALAREWGNLEYGIRELSQKDGESEMEAYCWDTETNVKSSRRFVVKHERVSGRGTTALTDPRDIYERVANDGARRLRSCILAVIPGDIIDTALEECRKTLAGDNKEPREDKIRRITKAFAQMGITIAHIEGKYGKRMADLFDDDLADLREIYNSLKDGVSKPTDWFDVPRAPQEHAEAADISETIRGKGKQQADPPPIIDPFDDSKGTAGPDWNDTGELPLNKE